ncbi:MAG: SIS domain-containing protein, partial [Anaerolineaceae bacterium]
MNIHQERYLGGLQFAVSQLQAAEQLGFHMAQQGVRRIFFVACGAPNRVMESIQYWVDQRAVGVETHRYFPAEFIHQPPRRVEPNSLVILMSDSGRTPEVLEAARFVQANYRCHLLAITGREESPLGQACPLVIAHGEGPVGFEAKFMVLLALISAWMQGCGEWDMHAEIMTGLAALPAAMAQAEEQAEPYNLAQAERFAGEDFYLVTGSGPLHPVAYSLGVCIMMEALWIKVFEGPAAEFFHGPFEVVDPAVPVMLFMGEDPSRPIAERVRRFCERFTEK